MRSKVVFLVELLFCCTISVRAQDTVAFTPELSYDFINEEANVIHNAESLLPFYERLSELKNEKNSVVSILHIGDSHVQADFCTGITRELLQQQFGNAGLGLSFPGRAARTNESPLIYSSTKGEWDIQKITFSQNTLPIGIGGISLKTNNSGSSLRIKMVSPEYSFNRLTLFFQKDFNSYNLLVKDSIGQPLAIAGAFTEEANANTSKLILPYPVKQIQFETAQSLPAQKHFTFYGVSLENSNPGIRYHIVGINGARYRHFLSSPELLQQTKALDPSLIIISLGTNEASDHPHIDPKLRTQINSLVNELKRINPTAVVLLTTPADFFKKRTRRNPGAQTIKNKIIEAANNNHLPYWNLYEIGGGNHSADRWKKSALLQSDGIHFTKEGYALQGKLLYEAIIKGYNEYVLHRSSKAH